MNSQVLDGTRLPGGATMRVGPSEPTAPEPADVAEIATRIDVERIATSAATTTRAVTPEARLVADGWTPPTEALRVAIARREAIHSAVAGLKTRGVADASAVQVALAASDRDALLTAIIQNAVAAWLDSNCQSPTSELTAWSARAETMLLAAVYAAPEAVLASLASVEDPDAHWLRSEAVTAATPSSQMFSGTTGQPIRNRPSAPSMFKTMVAR